MRLLSFNLAGRDTWGAVAGDKVVDLGAATGIPTLAEFIGSTRWSEREALAAAAAPVASLAGLDLLPPIGSCPSSRRSSCESGARRSRTASRSCGRTCPSRWTGRASSR
jgi:hypothetical protein